MSHYQECQFGSEFCVPISSSQCQETVKSFPQENQDLRRSSVNPSDQLNSTKVSLVFKESNVTAAKEDECSIPRPDYDKKLDAYAASELESMVPYIPELEADSILQLLAANESCITLL
ncbi:hypothetical protein MTR67_008011 [Solanum verrucosum]|uniref:Uncharacterized protein n=1 Tax=Solanum verrucosum TaxID=315347 RepID=A0AAF0Q0W1_SOLVR|nr:hypothetical protein MTR67_008011 [Solanum verrucosum]